MSSLVAILSSGKGTWAYVSSLISKGSWDKVYLICNDYAYDNFKVDMNKVIKLKIDENNPEKSIRILSNFFKEQVKDFEVALNLVSGSGLEHMAILSAVLKSGLGVRFVYFKNNDVVEMKIFDQEFSVDDDYLNF